MAADTVIITKLSRAALGGAQFGPVFRVEVTDGRALTSPVVLNVTNGNALTGFPPNFAHGGGGAGFTPDGSQVRVRPVSNASLGGVAAASVREDSFIKDTNDATNTSMALTIDCTASVCRALIIECPL